MLGECGIDGAGLELRYLVTLAEVGARRPSARPRTPSAIPSRRSASHLPPRARGRDAAGGAARRAEAGIPHAGGRLLAGHAGAIAARLASAAADLDALARGTAGLLRVGCYQSVGSRLLPPVMREFAAAWPQVEVRLSEAQDDGELLADLEGGGST